MVSRNGMKMQSDGFCLDELFKAYYDARRNKRNTPSQLRFELNLEENIVRLYRELTSRKYVVGTSICFIICDSVKREVFAADFRDRIVHQLLYNRLYPFFDRKFIYDSYSCRNGKGTLFGIRRLYHHIRSCSDNYHKDCYILKLDLKGYFININRILLYSMIEDALPMNFPDRDFILWLTDLVVSNEPVVNCRFKGSLSEWIDLPRSKSLFYTENGRGMPIGNLTSQLFSNIYLNKFDHWIKRECRCLHYGRYVDDFYIIHPSKDYLLDLKRRISLYISSEHGIELHPDKIYIQHFSKGVRFLGADLKPYRVLPGKRMRAKMHRMLSELESGRSGPEEMRNRLNSYFGLMRHMSSRSFLRKKIASMQTPFHYGYVVSSSKGLIYRLNRSKAVQFFSCLH